MITLKITTPLHVTKRSGQQGSHKLQVLDINEDFQFKDMFWQKLLPSSVQMYNVEVNLNTCINN